MTSLLVALLDQWAFWRVVSSLAGTDRDGCLVASQPKYIVPTVCVSSDFRLRACKKLVLTATSRPDSCILILAYKLDLCQLTAVSSPKPHLRQAASLMLYPDSLCCSLKLGPGLEAHRCMAGRRKLCRQQLAAMLQTSAISASLLFPAAVSARILTTCIHVTRSLAHSLTHPLTRLSSSPRSL